MKTALGTVSKVLIYLNLLSFSCAMYGHSKEDRQPHAKQHVKSHLGSTYNKQLASQALTKSEQVIDARYSFDGNINEQQNDYDLALLGLQTQQYESRDDNQAIALSDRTWLELPEQLHREIQTDKSLSLSVDFFFKNTGVDESVRVILSNKD